MNISNACFKYATRVLIGAGLLLGVAASQAVAQQATLSLSSGSSAPGGNVSLNLSLATSGGATPTIAQWTMTYSASVVTSASVVAGASTTAAGKSVQCSSASGSTKCIAFGMSNNVIGDGSLATITFAIAAGASGGSTAVSLSGVAAANASDVTIPASGVGGSIIVTVVAPPVISGLSCVPASVNAPGTSACAVTLSAAALTGGLVATLGSNNGNVTLPASVTIPAGASNAAFTATVAAVASNQSATLTASNGGVSQTFSLGIVAPRWNISGTITPASRGAGAMVTLSGAASAAATADASGNFTFTALLNGAYTVTPSQSGSVFTPANTSVTVSGANVTGVAFTDQAQTWSISGSITPASLGAGATVTLSGAASASTIADASGNFTFASMLNGVYTVTPSQSGSTFTPTNRSVTVSGANVTGVAFTDQLQTWSISGSITPASLGAGATVTLGGAASASTIADASGNFKFASMLNGVYTVTPSQSGSTFTPINRSVTVSGASVTGVAFTAVQNQTSMTPTIDSQVWKDQTTANTKVTSPVFSTASGNELLLAFVATDDLANPHITVTGVSGAGLTWVLVNRTNVQRGTAEIWRAFAPQPLTSVSVTATLSKSKTSSLTVMSFTGIDASGTNGSGAIGAIGTGNASTGAPTAKLVTTRNNSLVVGVGNDPTHATARTLGSGQSLVHQLLSSDGNTYWVQRQSNPTALSGTSVTINDSAPTSDAFDSSISEILGAPASGGTQMSLLQAAPNAIVASPAVTDSAKALASQDSSAQRSTSLPPADSATLINPASGLAGPACSPGGLASIFGSGFTKQTSQKTTSFPLPVQLAGLQVTVNGQPAPLLFASESQANFQCPLIPASSALQVTVVADDGVATTPLLSSMQAAAPGVFTLGAAQQGVIEIATTSDIAMVTTDAVTSRPALPGESLTIYASGLGEVINGVPVGTPAPLDRSVPVKNRVSVVVGGAEIAPTFAGLVPGTAGLFQVNMQLPTSAPAGTAVLLYLRVFLPDGTVFESNRVTLAIGVPTVQ